MNEEKMTSVHMVIPEYQRIFVALKLNFERTEIKNNLSIQILGWQIACNNSLLEHINKLKGPVLSKLRG